MRGFWRLGRARHWLGDGAGRRRRAEALDGTWRWYVALAVKLPPGLWRWPVRLKLRGGNVIEVRQFMTLVIFDEIFVQRCYDVPLSASAPVIVDVGANTGLFALWAVRRWPGARVHCYEPYPPNYTALTRAAAGLDGVRTFPQAVGSHARTASLHVHPSNLGGHSLVTALSGTASVSVPVCALGEVLDRLPGGRCDLLKLDCEGAEVEILQALSPVASRIGGVVCELTPGHGDWAAIATSLRDLGYETRQTGKLLHAVRPEAPPAAIQPAATLAGAAGEVVV